MRIVMQPARRSEKDVFQHYRDTVLDPVVFAEHADLLDQNVSDQLQQLFPAGSAQMWGIVPGKNGANLAQIRKISPGDWVFFCGDKKIYLGGTIALTWHNPALAERLWSKNHNGQTWEHMYALSGTRGFDIPMDEVRQLLDWNHNRNIMGISVLKQAEGEALQTLLTLDASVAALPELDPASTEEAVEAFSGELERVALSARRGEQAALKRRLLPGPTGECALCGRTLPGTFLVGAHIKKRAVCSEEEKRDLSNIAMLACTLGCDALYEHGYVSVAPGGVIQISPLAASAHEVDTYVRERLMGRVVRWWSSSREPYFEWHRTHTFKQGLQ
jgi:hypothetical protein